MQYLSVKFGSKMTQNLEYHPHSGGARDNLVHEVWSYNDEMQLRKSIEENKPRYKPNKWEINSLHHQCVNLNNLGEDLAPLLVATNEDAFLDGNDVIVEAFCHKTLPVVGVQWHPEELNDLFSITCLQGLLNRDLSFLGRYNRDLAQEMVVGL